jgi:hypothetical protein
MNKGIKNYFDDSKRKINDSTNKIVVKSVIRHSKDFIKSIEESDSPRAVRKYAYHQYCILKRLAERKIRVLN